MRTRRSVDPVLPLLLLCASACGFSDGSAPNGLGSEVPVPPGRETWFMDLSLGCFFTEEGKSLEELGYQRGDGRFGWNVPCDACLFDGRAGAVECSGMGNTVRLRFEGTRVSVTLGMDVEGDQFRFIINPGSLGQIDAGWINTCAGSTPGQQYPAGREPKRRIANEAPGHEQRNLRYRQTFEIARELRPGVHVLQIECFWMSQYDPEGPAFSHLICIRPER